MPAYFGDWPVAKTALAVSFLYMNAQAYEVPTIPVGVAPESESTVQVLSRNGRFYKEQDCLAGSNVHGPAGPRLREAVESQ